MADTTNTELAEQIEAFVDAVTVRDDLFYKWQTGAADGGPDGDGNYPLTDLTGFTRMVPCPAKIAAIAQAQVSAEGTNLEPYATIAARDLVVDSIPGQLAYVYANNGAADDPANGVYQWDGAAWIAAPWFFNGVAAVVQPLVDLAIAAADAAAASAALIVDKVKTGQGSGTVSFLDKYRTIIKEIAADKEIIAGSEFRSITDALYRRIDQFGAISEEFMLDGTRRAGSTAENERPLSTVAVNIWAGAPTSSGFRVTAEVEGYGPGVCQLVVSSDAAFARREFISQPAQAFETSRTDTDNWRSIKLEATGLDAGTLYYYRIDVDGRAGTTRQLTTMPTSGDFTFAFGSCNTVIMAGGRRWVSWAAITNKAPLFFLHLGDMSYSNIGTDDIRLQRNNNVRLVRRKISEAETLAAKIPIIYQFDNHDSALPNGWTEAYGATTYERVVANSRKAYDETMPHFDLAADADGTIGQAFAFDVAGVRFIVFDAVSFRDGVTFLGARQTAWVHAQLLGAVGMDQVFLCSSENWTTELQGWGATGAAEQVALCNFIRDTPGIPPCTVLTGDMHYSAVDDGTHTDKSTGGGLALPQIMSSGLAQSAFVPSVPANFFSWLGAASNFYINDAAAWMQQFVMVTVFEAGGWEAKIYGDPYAGDVPTLLGTYNSNDL